MKNSGKVGGGTKARKEAKAGSGAHESAVAAAAAAAAAAGFRSKDERLEQLQADHELFLQAFEKPTQIYRYLRTRTLISPIFLNRTLAFMRSRMNPRSNNARLQGFKVDSLLERKIKENSDSLELQSVKAFMTLTFLGYYDKKREKPLDKVNVELLLIKVNNVSKKSKDGTGETPLSNVVQLPVGQCDVPVNPSEEHPPNKAPALSVASESFSLSNGQHVKSCSLMVRVVPSVPITNGDSSSASNGGDSTTCSSTNGDENQEPATKRRKVQSRLEPEFKLLSRELIIYDKYSRCMMTEGEYELFLTEPNCQGQPACSKKGSSWENTMPQQTSESYGQAPTLKFRLSWSNEPAGALVERPRPLMPRDNAQDLVTLRSKDIKHNGVCTNGVANGIGGPTSRKSNGKSYDKSGSMTEKQPGILYQFLYNNNSRQQTEAKDDLRCPWCCLNCQELYALLKHLKLSHPRFLFTYLPIQEGARIDVSVSELFDSTYVGNPNDLISQPPGFAFSRHGPVQRTPITNILVCKPKRSPPSLSEFLEIEENDLNGPYDGQRPFVTGHNRLYNYSTTNLPMPPYAILQPSTEDQVDPPWLMTKICRMIDEFSDVNDGEKELMKMWNLHVQHYTFVGDRQMGTALRMFVEEKGHELLEKRLYRNFILHLCNMFEFGVLGPGHVFTAVSRLQQFIKDHDLKPHLGHWATLSANAAAKAKRNVKGEEQRPRKDFSGIFRKEETTTTTSGLKQQPPPPPPPLPPPPSSTASTTEPLVNNSSETEKEPKVVVGNIDNHDKQVTNTAINNKHIEKDEEDSSALIRTRNTDL